MSLPQLGITTGSKQCTVRLEDDVVIPIAWQYDNELPLLFTGKLGGHCAEVEEQG